MHFVTDSVADSEHCRGVNDLQAGYHPTPLQGCADRSDSSADRLEISWCAAGSSVKQLAQKYFGAPGADGDERVGDPNGGSDFGVDSTQALNSRAAQVPAGLAQVRAGLNAITQSMPMVHSHSLARCQSPVAMQHHAQPAEALRRACSSTIPCSMPCLPVQNLCHHPRSLNTHGDGG